MKDKHLHIYEDSALLKLIHQQIGSDLHTRKRRTSALLVGKFLLYCSMMVVCYYGIITFKTSLLFFAGFIFYGMFSILLSFNFAHDFSHNTVFGSKRLNNAAFTIIYTFVGAHADAWKLRHINAHHYAPNVEHYDSDLQITSLMRIVPGSPYKWFHRYQHIYAPVAYTIYSLYWVFVKDFVIYFFDNQYRHHKTIGYHIFFWLQKLCYVLYLLWIPLSFSNQPAYMVVTGFLLMHFIQSLFLLFTFFITHHVEKTEYFGVDDQGYINTSWLSNQVRSSNDFHPFSPTANFIFGGFNNHIAHHLFPHIHHVHYPALNKILYKVLIEHGIEPNVTSFFGGVVSHLKHLKRMGECYSRCFIAS